MVSIIVGVYNVASFLREKRLECIFSQSYTDWELILVDDGSTDGSGLLCDEFAQQDNRIKVFHKENGGLGSARNAGIDLAKGEYLWFYDVDDQADPTLLEYCVAEMEQKNLEMLQFGFRAITPSQNLEEDVYLNECLIESQEQLQNSFINNILLVKYGNGFAWNKFLRHSFIDKYHLRYENQRILQDQVFNLKLYPLLQRVYLSPKVLYHYYIFEQGNNRSKFISNRFDIYVSIRDRFELLRQTWNIKDSRYDDYLQNLFFAGVDQTLRFNLLHPDSTWSKEEKKREMQRVMNHPYTKEAIEWAKKRDSRVENKLYMQAYSHHNLTLLSLYSSLFQFLRKIKRKIT